MDDEQRREMAERLKDIAGDFGAMSLRATFPNGRDQWLKIHVHHASLFSDAPDGWDTEIAEGGL